MIISSKHSLDNSVESVQSMDVNHGGGYTRVDEKYRQYRRRVAMAFQFFVDFFYCIYGQVLPAGSLLLDLM